MVCELCCHRRGSLLPFAPRRWLWNGAAQRVMRAYEIEDRILKCEMAPQEKALLRMRQSFTHQAPDTLARGEVVTFDIRRVDLLATKHLGDDVARTEDDTSANLDHASLLASVVHLRIESCRIQHPSRRVARAPTTAWSWRRLWRAVVGNEGRDVRRQLITGAQGRVPIRACFEGCQKSRRLLLAALVRQMGHDAEMTRQGERTPHPGVTPVGRVTRLQMRLFFLTKLQSSSTCTCVGCTSRMKERLTAAPCCPARSNQCSVASTVQCLIRLTARRLLRSTSIATTSRRSGRGVRSVSKNVPLSALKVR